MTDITPLTPTRVKSYNKLLKKILNKPVLELFFEVGIGLIEVEPDEHLINKIVQELADRKNLNINDLNLYLRQINEFYNASIASYDLVDTENPVQEDLSKLEKIVATFMQLESEEKNREIIISACDKAIETIAHEYGFWEELHSIVTYDELVKHIDSVFGEMIALNTGFFSLMDISRMLKKGATEDEFYEFSMLMTIILASYNEVRKYRYEFMQEEEYPPLEVLVKPYMKTKVATLFSLGIEAMEEDDFSYKALGLSGKNKKQLLELGSDLALYYYESDEEDECLEFFAVLHAWRALSELEIPEAKILFVDLLRQLFEEEDDLDWMARLFKKLILPFRADMFDESVSYILDENENEWFRAEFINLLQSMLHNNEIERNSLSKVFEKLFKTCENPIVNATAIAVCKDEKLTEYYSQIKKLYEKKWVDKSLDGDLEDVELAFEMRSERSTVRDLGLHDFQEESFETENLLPEQRKAEEKIGRNDPCPCGSGKKYKKCCMKK